MTRIRSQNVVLPDGVRPATLRLEGGRVVDVGEGEADLDFGDLVVLPGLVDSHVHVNEPGRTEWEGFVTATRAALAGGTTTVVDMPLNSIPPTVDVDALTEKRQAAAHTVSCDVAFWGGIVPGSEPHVDDLIAEGVCGFKVFTVDSGVDEFPPLDAELLSSAAHLLKETSVPLLVHAEDPQLLREPEGDPRSYATYLATRPGAAEASAIDAIRPLAAGGSRIHILHVAGAEATEALRRAQGSITGETCPHYLTFAAESVPDGATAFKCAPPIRSAEHREALWEALGDGTLTMVVSDHSPAPPALKEVGSGNFLTAWGGIASLELRLPATWDGARRRGFEIDRLAAWLAERPAALAGLADRKGSIAEGMDADLVVFDPDGVTEADASRLRQRHPLTPYHGMRLAGSVVATFLRGVEFHAGNGPGGRLLRRGD